MRRINTLSIAFTVLAISFSSNVINEGVASSSLSNHSTTTVKSVVHTTTTQVKASKFHGPLKHWTKPPKGWPWGVTQNDLRMWSKVNICEEGGNWHVRGSIYSGGLGMRNDVWSYYSRGMGFSASAADATPVQQVAVAKKINTGYGVPDQNGCHAW